MSTIGKEKCIVCQGRIKYYTWKLVWTKGKGVQVLCSPSCVDMYKLNPLAYANEPFDNYDDWIGPNSARCWTVRDLKLEDKWIVA